MEETIRTLPAEVLLEQYRQLLREDPTLELPLRITGGSMTPFLAPGRDTVFLSGLKRPAHRGDILLYRRDSGAYILHRVYRTTPAGLTMLGDAQQLPEPGIRPDQILAVVTAVERKGRYRKPGSLLWQFFAGPWLGLRPLRFRLCRLYEAIRPGP